MEIFQTIWTALSTPNEGLITILSIPLTFIEMTVTMLLFTSILNIKADKKQKVIYVVLLTCWGIISNIFIPNPLLTVLNIIILPLCAMAIFKISFFKSIISEILPLIVMAILDPIFINIITFIFNITYTSIVTVPIYRLLFVLCIYLTFFILYLLIKHFGFNITLLDDMNKSTRNILIFNSVFGIITIFIQRYLSNYYTESLPLMITSIATLSLLAYFCISMYSLIRTTKLEITEQNLQEAQLYNKSLKILHDNVRAFKHDFSNIVQAIGRLC